MNSSALRIVAALLAVGAAVLGYVGYQASHKTQGSETELSETDNVEKISYPIIIAAEDISATQKITADDLELVMVDRQISDSFSDEQSLIGLTSRMPISSGDMFVPEHFHTFGAISANLISGERAVAVKVDEVTGVGDYIEPGDKVDVLVFLPAGPETDKQSSAQLLLPSLRVIAYGDQIDELNHQQIRQKSRAYLSELEKHPVSDLLAETDSSKKAKNPSGQNSKTAVLAVNQSDVSTLLLAESTGRLRLALVGIESFDHKSNALATSQNNNHFISLQALKGPTLETAPSSSKDTPLSIKSTPKKPPAQITVHRGLQETVVNLKQEK